MNQINRQSFGITSEKQQEKSTEAKNAKQIEEQIIIAGGFPKTRVYLS